MFCYKVLKRGKNKFTFKKNIVKFKKYMIQSTCEE